MLMTMLLAGGAIILAGFSFAVGYYAGWQGREGQAERDGYDLIDLAVDEELVERGFSEEQRDASLRGHHRVFR